MKPQWNGPLLRSCIWSVLLWRCFFFTFWSGIALMSLLWRPWATKILPPIPAIEGSVKQDLSLFAQISFFVSQIHISIMESKFFFFKTHHLIPLIYIFFYVVLDQCWDAMYFPLSRSFLVYLSRFLSEHLMKRSHLGQLWGGRQQGSWATCSNSPCLYFSRSHCQVIVIGLTFQCNRCGNNFAPINNMEKRLCRAGHLNRRSQSTSSSNALVWKNFCMVSAWTKLSQKWQIPTFSNSNVRQFDGTYVALR